MNDVDLSSNLSYTWILRYIKISIFSNIILDDLILFFQTEFFAVSDRSVTHEHHQHDYNDIDAAAN